MAYSKSFLCCVIACSICLGGCANNLLKTEDPKVQLFTKLFQEVEDPVGLYVALIMHDTGRAENFRKHEDGSAMLASDRKPTPKPEDSSKKRRPNR